MPLGRHGALTLAQARAAARKVLGEVANGVDVAEARAEAKRKAGSDAAKPTLVALLERWVALGLANQRERYKREAARALRVAFAAHLKRRAEHLTRAEVVRAMDALQARGKAVMAAR